MKKNERLIKEIEQDKQKLINEFMKKRGSVENEKSNNNNKRSIGQSKTK